MPLLTTLRRPRVLLFVFLLLAVLTAIAIRQSGGSAIETLTVQQGDIRQSVVASGKVRSPQRSEIAAQVAAQVRAVAVYEGQQVAAADPLIELDDRELRAATEQARAQLQQSELRLAQLQRLTQPLAQESIRQSEANLAQAKRHFDRVETLVGKGFYSTTQLDEARRALTLAQSQFQSSQLQAHSSARGGSDFQLAEAGVAQARAALALAESRLAYTRILAPRAGTILARLVEPGDTVQPGKTLLTLSPAGETELIVQIDEKNLRLLALDQIAQVSADAWPDQGFSARLSFISPAVDALRGSVEVRLRVDNPPNYLKQDMTVSIDITTGEKTGVVLLPLEALRGTPGETWVLVVRDGRATRQAVETGLRNAGQIEVLNGLAAGEAVIPASSAKLQDGDKVRLAN